MSRIGRLPFTVPAGVDVTIDETRSTRQGLLLMRIMTGASPQWLTEADLFRQLLRCEQSL